VEPSEIRLPSPRQLAAEFDIPQRRRLGQCYLANTRTLDKIVGAAKLDPETAAVEIGTGPGYLTARILRRTRRVWSIEMDERFRPVHEKCFGGLEPPVRFIYEDVLELDWRRLLEEIGGGRYVVLGNIPYQITSPLIAVVLGLDPPPERSVLLVQREFAQRLAARPGRKAYGALTAKTALVAEVRQAVFVPRQRFQPRPRVDGAAVVIERRPEPLVEPNQLEEIFRFIDACFAHRRKKIVNSLLGSGFLGNDREAIAALLAEAEIPPGQRPENLSVEEYVRLWEVLRKRKEQARRSEK